MWKMRSLRSEELIFFTFILIAWLFILSSVVKVYTAQGYHPSYHLYKDLKTRSIFNESKRIKESDQSKKKCSNGWYYGPSDRESDQVNGVGESNHLPHSGIPDLTIAKLPSPHTAGMKQGSFLWVHSDMTLLLYSAHYDAHDKHIKFTGLQSRVISPDLIPVACKFPGRSGKKPFKEYFNISLDHAYSGNDFDAMVWTCPVETVYVPKLVRLAYNKDPFNFAEIKVMYKPKPVVKRMTFGVCVQPLTPDYGDALQLIQFVEAARLFGAQKIILYYAGHNDTIIPLFQDYRENGILDVYDWNPPVEDGMEARLFGGGAVTAQQHCLYMYKTTIKNLLFMEINQLLVPGITQKTWHDVVNQAKMSNPLKRIGAFLIPTRQFSLQSSDDLKFAENEAVLDCGITSLLKLSGSQPSRSEISILIDTEVVEVLDLYQVRKMRDNVTISVVVDPRIATVHTYVETAAPTASQTVSPITRFSDKLIAGITKYCYGEADEHDQKAELVL